MTNQLIIPFRGLDANARPQAGALCYVYQSGTTTPVTVTNATGTALAWPVVADLNGAFPQMFYAGSMALKAVLQDATGAALPGGTIDPVAVVTNVSTASAIAFVPTDEVAQTNVQAAIDALGVKATISAGTAITITTPSGTPVIGVTPGPLTQLAGLALVQGDTLYRDASAVARLPKGVAGQALRMNAAANAPEWGSPGVLASAQASTAGTSIDFTAPTGFTPRRVTVLFSGVSTNGGNQFLVQGGAGSFETTGYFSVGDQFNSGSSSRVPISSTTGYLAGVTNAAGAAAGVMTLIRLNPAANTWVAQYQEHTFDGSSFTTIYGTGTKTFTGALDRIRLTTVGSTDTFDAGSVNVLWE